MPTYRVDSAKSRVISRARSSIHDTTTRWGAVSGTIQASADTLESEGASAELSVDMSDFDAGDFLRNRKLKKDLDLARHPEARFELEGLDRVERRADGGFSARARGTIRWRGREATVAIEGSARLDDEALEAEGRFEVDVTELGVTPPRFLMLKVEDVVEVEVSLKAKRAP